MGGHTKLEGEAATKAGVMLRHVCAVLEKVGVPYTLDGGTLLGLVRENRFLPWDDDMDLFVPKASVPRLMLACLLLLFYGYQFRFRFMSSTLMPFAKHELRMVKIKSYCKPKMVVDVILKKKIDQRYWWVVGKDPVLKAVAATFLDDRQQQTFSMGRFYVPVDCEGYLTCRYGDWKKPVKEWNFKRDDQALLERPKGS